MPIPSAAANECQVENLAIFDFGLSADDMAAIATLGYFPRRLVSRHIEAERLRELPAPVFRLPAYLVYPLERDQTVCAAEKESWVTRLLRNLDSAAHSVVPSPACATHRRSSHALATYTVLTFTNSLMPNAPSSRP
jgi:hypothetical protein